MKRIADARAALAESYATNPAGVQKFNLRMSRLTAAKKREQERFDHVVIGKPWPAPDLQKPAGMSKLAWKVERKRLLDEHSEAVRRWEEGRYAARPLVSTEAYSRAHADAIIQLRRNGTISEQQAEWVAQISNVHRSIEADVAINIASMEARVDQSRSAAHLVGERINRVRLHRAYTDWRTQLPAPRQMVLDMIVGDAIGYTVAARRHRVHNRKTKRLLIEAIDRWPICVERAFETVTREVVDLMNRAVPIAAADRTWLTPINIRPSALSPVIPPPDAAIGMTGKPMPLADVDPEFVDDRGYMRQWTEIAAILRNRASREETDEAA